MSAYKNPLAPAKRERVPTYNMTQAQLDAVREEGFRAGIAKNIGKNTTGRRIEYGTVNWPG